LHICLICEGSYPYVVGGVSSWTHTLIREMSQHTFSIATLYPSVSDKGNFKYKLPSNVTGVSEFFLDVLGREYGTFKRKFKVADIDIETIIQLFRGEDIDWSIMFDFFERNKNSSAQDFLMSRVFYDAIIGTYQRSYAHVALNDFFWTIRSMILPLTGIMGIDMPEADLYHSLSTGYAGVMASKGKRDHNAGMLLTEHGIYTREREEEIIGAGWVPVHFKDLWIKYFHNLSKCAYKHTDTAITLFEDARVIQNELGCDSAKQIVVENGVNVDRLLQLPRKKLGEGSLSIGAVVRVVPIKDILTMLQAFNLVHEAYPNAEFYIMGPNDESVEYYEECVSITRLMGLEDVVRFTGMVKVTDYFPKMDVMVLSSISEGQPLVVLEAMAAGIPNVTTNVGSCREILYGKKEDTLGKAGIVVPVMDYHALAEGIIKIVTNKKLHDQMAAIGEERVKKLYTRERFIKNYADVYASFENKGE